jgi:arginyl-tRNA synthetase
VDVYVRANREAAADPSLEQAARAAFSQLEAGQSEQRARWAACRHLSIGALAATYARLNIKFDEYDGESMYSAAATQVFLFTNICFCVLWHKILHYFSFC